MSARKQSLDSPVESQVTKLLELQRELLKIVALSAPLQTRLDRICGLFEQAVQGMVATTMRLDPDKGTLHFISAPSAPRELLDQLDQVHPGEGNGSCAHAAWSRQATYVSDATHDPHWRNLQHVAQAHGVHSCWSAPVHDRQGTVLGTFALTSLHSGLPDAYHRHLLDLGALSVGLLFDQEHERSARAENDREIRRLALAADTSSNGIMFTDRDGTLEWSNAGAQALLERSPEAIQAKNLRDVLTLPANDSDLQSALVSIRRGEPYACTLQLQRSDDRTWFAQLSCTPRLDPKGHCDGAVVMLVDVTALHRLTEFNVLLAAVDKAIARQGDPDALMQTVCDLAVRHARFRLAWIGAPDPESRWFTPIASAGPGRGYLDEVRISANTDLAEGRGPCGRTWHDGHGRFDRVFESDPELKPWAQAAREHGFASVATLPIRRAGKLWALLSVYHAELDSFDASLQQLLETLAFNISSGLDRIDMAHREREIQALNEAMLESATVGVVLTHERIVMRANHRAAEILGAPRPEDLHGIDAASLYSDADDGRAAAQRVQEAFDAGRRAILETAVQRLDGHKIWLRLEGAPFQREGYDAIWSLIDQTEQHRTLETRLLLANALASVQDGVIITDAEQRTVYVNEAFHTLTGYDFTQISGRKCSVLQGPDTDPKTIARIRDDLHNEREFVGEILNYRKDGSSFWNQLTINPLRDEHGRINHFVGVLRDISNLRKLNARLEHLAFHDELTGLPNRRALDRFFTETLPSAIEHKHTLALGIIDLDDFKAINDTHGHDCGDSLLKTITKRILPNIGEQDFFARLGGDEFVVVLHETSRFRVGKRLRKRFEAIGKCFAEPFDIGLEKPLKMGLSMGVALCPKHATAGGELLRLADTALFQAKKHKMDRARWWSIHGETDTQDSDVSIETYGASAARLLAQTEPHLLAVLPDVVEDFYRLLREDPHAARILQGLKSPELEELKRSQLDHLQFLVRGDISRADLGNTAHRIGRTHALIGIDSVLLMRWMSTYHERLASHCNGLPIGSRQRYHLLQLLDHRLQDDLQAQLEAQGVVQDQYAAIIDQFMPDRGSGWNDAISLELRLLARLPGTCCTMILRQSGPESFNIESSSGRSARTVARLLREYYGNNHPARVAPSENSLITQSWQAVEIRTAASMGSDNKHASGSLPDALTEAGVHSAACIPIFDEQRLPVAMLLMLGHFPNQFESKYMWHFMRNLQLRGNEIWQRSMRPPPPVPHEQAVAYRRRLFRNGLRMLLQPIIDLHDGRLIKAEALARLELEDGTLLGPDVFLPLLRHGELDTLFQRGLDMALANLVELDRQGLHIDLALNIAPGTLADPDCREWVEQALERHGIEPQRLILEILENQRVDRKLRDSGVQRMVELGVRFSIDDLGSGYSSLRRLASLPFHAVKVDQDLISRLHVDPVQSVSLISAVVQIGRDFGCLVIAEGLEDAGMIEVARLLGATMGQGFAIARPMPAADLPAWSRDFRYDTQGAGLKTPLGALAFQWISLRHESLHTPALEDCPLSAMIEHGTHDMREAAALHEAVHAAPDDEVAARRLLDWLQTRVRRDLEGHTGEWT